MQPPLLGGGEDDTRGAHKTRRIAGPRLEGVRLTCAADVPGGRLSHDQPWLRGNHEDGYLTGLANLQRLWRRVLKEL